MNWSSLWLLSITIKSVVTKNENSFASVSALNASTTKHKIIVIIIINALFNWAGRHSTLNSLSNIMLMVTMSTFLHFDDCHRFSDSAASQLGHKEEAGVFTTPFHELCAPLTIKAVNKVSGPDNHTPQQQLNQYVVMFLRAASVVTTQLPSSYSTMDCFLSTTKSLP